MFDTRISDGTFTHRQLLIERYDEKSTHDVDHTCLLLGPNSTLINVPWQSIINCTTCKYSLVEGIGLSILQLGMSWVSSSKKLVLAGCFTDHENIARTISPGESIVPQPEPKYYSNAKEADLRIWRHAAMCDASNVLIYSPNKDVYYGNWTLFFGGT